MGRPFFGIFKNTYKTSTIYIEDTYIDIFPFLSLFSFFLLVYHYCFLSTHVCVRYETWYNELVLEKIPAVISFFVQHEGWEEVDYLEVVYWGIHSTADHIHSAIYKVNSNVLHKVIFSLIHFFPEKIFFLWRKKWSKWLSFFFSIWFSFHSIDASEEKKRKKRKNLDTQATNSGRVWHKFR